MSRLDQDRVLDILADAVELPAALRGAFLDSTCGDPELRREVEELLTCADPASAAFDAASQQIVQPDPEQIGPYEILEPVGEGGMATVYKARQHDPVKRIVALKIIKLGMDTRQFVSRFGSERQALAMMDHPNVARVYDAGSTDTGRPYFVMEYVAGQSILEYCDGQNLRLRQRLELFVVVCDAVEHAHRKGIIHRDIKNSNILVTQVDGKAVPKVIDFGVAKTIQEPRTDGTMFTEQGQLIGTPEYMSPEQAERGTIDIDTRSDVYSLGVLLYELIAGVQPIPSHLLRSAGYEQVQRIIRETEPARPSTRLSTLAGADATRIAQRRKTALPTLIRELHSELEWIPLKAMRKNREQRYRSAAELADDIRNFLEGRPLIAGPESTGYRLRKFLRRHKTGVAASAAMLLLLVGGIVATTWQAMRANREAAAARKQASIAGSVNDLMTDMISKANRGQQRGDPNITVRAVMDAAAAELSAGGEPHQPEVAAALRHAIGQTYDALGLYDVGEPLLRDAIDQWTRIAGELSPEVATARTSLAILLHHKGDDAGAETLFRQALEARQMSLGDEHPEVAIALNNLAGLLTDRGNYAASEPLLRQALAMRRKFLGNEHPDVAASLTNLGALLSDKGDYAAAEPHFREALSMHQKLSGAESPEVAYTLNNLAVALQRKGDYEGAESLFREALALRRKLFGDTHPSVATGLDNLGSLLRRKQDFAAAERLAREALEMRRTLLGDEHPDVAQSLTNLGNLVADQGDLDGAEQYFRDALALRRKLLGEENWLVAQSLSNLASILSDKGDHAGAEPLIREALHASRRSVGDNHPNTLTALANLGLLLAGQARYDEAEPLLRELFERVPQSQTRPQEGAPYMSYYGMCLVRLKRYEQAEKPLKQAYQRLIESGLEGYGQTRAVVTSLAEVCDQTNRPDEAAEWRAKLEALEAVTQPATTPATNPG